MDPIHIVKDFIVDAIQVKYLIILGIMGSLMVGGTYAHKVYDKVSEEITPVIKDVVNIPKIVNNSRFKEPIHEFDLKNKNPVLLI